MYFMTQKKREKAQLRYSFLILATKYCVSEISWPYL